MNPAHRASPDSEAVASDEDERPWPSATSFGTLPRKEANVPGLPGGIWSTQRRGSFKVGDTAQRPAIRDTARLATTNPAHNALRIGSTPSPAIGDVASPRSFAIPSNNIPKLGRSLSHSQVQRELLQDLTQRSIPLGLLAEEADSDTDSDHEDATFPSTRHRPSFSTLHRVATLPASYNGHHIHHNASQSSMQSEKSHNARSRPHEQQLETTFAGLGLGQSDTRPKALWQSHLGWNDLPQRNESRRHSLAEIPTRRGSPEGDSPYVQSAQWAPQPRAMVENPTRAANMSTRNEPSIEDIQQIRAFGEANNTRRASEATINMNRNSSEPVFEDIYNIPSQYKAPFLAIDESEHETMDPYQQQQHGQQQPMLQHQGHTNSYKPRKILYIISFKCSRVDVFYLLENTGLHVREGDIVIVEADRGQDLGTVQHANVTPDEARIYKRKYSEEQYKWLMMFSRNNAQGNVNPNSTDGYVQNGPMMGGSVNQMGGMVSNAQGLPRENHNNLKPKAIKRLANPHEIKMLSEKEHNEAKAKRACQQKVTHLHLQMEILDAEWQWDFQKLIFYYYADHYINFKDLITDLYRIYKTRIWLSAVNPASFSQHAMGQPPSGIGPGAITSFGNNMVQNNGYTMAYGADPDPYGAVPPYRIGYDTYTPNYPAIPGVANSFHNQQPQANLENLDPNSFSMAMNPAMQSHQSWALRGHQTQQFSPTVQQSGFNASNSAFPTQSPQQHFTGATLENGIMQSPQTESSASWGGQPFRPAQSESFGSGRLIDSQAPIGTRPVGSRQNSQHFSYGRPSSLARANSIASPLNVPFMGSGSSQLGQANGSFADADSAMSQSHTPISTGARGGAVNKQSQVKNYLSSLPDPAGGYADAMSRER